MSLIKSFFLFTCLIATAQASPDFTDIPSSDTGIVVTRIIESCETGELEEGQSYYLETNITTEIGGMWLQEALHDQGYSVPVKDITVSGSMTEGESFELVTLGRSDVSEGLNPVIGVWYDDSAGIVKVLCSEA